MRYEVVSHLNPAYVRTLSPEDHYHVTRVVMVTDADMEELVVEFRGQDNLDAYKLAADLEARQYSMELLWQAVAKVTGARLVASTLFGSVHQAMFEVAPGHMVNLRHRNHTFRYLNNAELCARFAKDLKRRNRPKELPDESAIDGADQAQGDHSKYP